MKTSNYVFYCKWNLKHQMGLKWNFIVYPKIKELFG